MSGAPLHGEALLQALAGVAIDLQRAHRIDEVLTALGTGLRRIALSVVVLQNDPEGIRFLYQSMSDAEAAQLGFNQPSLGMLLPPAAQEPARAVQRHGQAMFLEDVTHSVTSFYAEFQPQLLPRVEQVLEASGYLKVVLVPLRVAGEWWGALAVGNNHLKPEDLPSLNLFAVQVSSALESAGVMERLEQRNRELEAIHAIASVRPSREVAELGEHLLRQVGQATASDAVTLHLFDVAHREYVMVAEPWGYAGPLVEAFRRFPEIDLGTGPAAYPTRLLPQGSELVATAGFEWLAMVPLIAEGRPLGLLTMGRKASRAYGTSEMRLAEMLGVQVASLVERARLYAQAQSKVRQLSLLFDLVRAGATAREVVPLLDQLADLLLEAFPADVAAISFVQNGLLVDVRYKTRAGLGLPAANPLPSIALDESTVTGRVAVRRKALRASASSFPPRTRQNLEPWGVRHMMVAPLVASDHLLGTVGVTRQSDPPFTDEDLALLENCAAQVAVLIEHVRLIDDLKKSYDQVAHAQSEVVRHERLAALGELAAVMAHEVRNPLGVIFNSLTSLKKALKPEGDAAMLLRIVGEEADRLNRIVGDLLDFARPYEAERKPIALEPVIASAVDSATQTVPGHRVKVVTEFVGELPQFMIDGHLVRQAMVNLVVNAIQAMPRGGTVTVRVWSEQRAGQRLACIEVKDQGVGISAEAAERIFQPFFTTKATGTGLGLAVVKRIIDAHHGEIAVSSSIGGGTTFTARLPGGPVEPQMP